MNRHVIVKIPCILCDRQFTKREVRKSINISTGVCFDCYREGIEMSPKEWCFAKKAEHDSESKECGSLCPDKAICRLITQGRIQL